MLLYAKRVFLGVNASLRWLNIIIGVYLVQVSLLLIGSAGFGTFLQVSVLASNWLEYCANFTPTPEENETTNTAPTALSAIQETSQSTLVV